MLNNPSKHILDIQKKISNIKLLKVDVDYGDTISIKIPQFDDSILEIAQSLKPWRKGPFKINDMFIDSEWKSNMKFDIIKKYFDIKNKTVADVGCNNGYYMFKMLEDKPTKIVGFDPSHIYKTQFDFINKFIQSDIRYELLGVEHIQDYECKFDVIFCLGVLYHRENPISTLKSLKQSLNNKGEVILDTFIIDGDDEYVLSPKSSYMKIPNIYFVPTLTALLNWCNRAKFKTIEVLEIIQTSPTQQRKTEWIDSQSLEDFVDFKTNLTCEGYPIPKRIFLKLGV